MSNGVAGCCNGRAMYVAEALRWGDREKHSYVVGVYSTRSRAEFAGKAEELWRGGKYECAVTKIIFNYIDEDAHKGYTKELEYERERANKD